MSSFLDHVTIMFMFLQTWDSIFKA